MNIDDHFKSCYGYFDMVSWSALSLEQIVTPSKCEFSFHTKIFSTGHFILNNSPLLPPQVLRKASVDVFIIICHLYIQTVHLHNIQSKTQALPQFQKQQHHSIFLYYQFKLRLTTLGQSSFTGNCPKGTQEHTGHFLF